MLSQHLGYIERMSERRSIFISKLTIFLDYAISSLSRDTWRSPGNFSVIAFAHDTTRSTVDGKANYSRLTDSLLDEFERQGHNVGSFALWGSRMTNSKAWRNPRSINRAALLAWLGSVLLRIVWNGKFYFRNVGPCQEALYRRIIRTSGARIVISVSPPIPLLKACHSLGVVSAEVIHGFGYRELPTAYKDRPGTELPTFVLARDGITANSMKPLASEGVGVITLDPFPRAGVEHSPNPFATSLNSSSDSPLPRQGSRKVLVAVSHGGRLDKPHFDLDLFKALLSHSTDLIFWTVRLHPVQASSARFRGFRQELARQLARYPNVELQESNRIDVRDAILSSDVLVTHFSEIVYEAALLKVPSRILIEQPARPEFDRFRNYPELEKAGVLAHLPIDIPSCVKSILDAVAPVDYTFSKNSLSTSEVVSLLRRADSSRGGFSACRGR